MLKAGRGEKMALSPEKGADTVREGPDSAGENPDLAADLAAGVRNREVSARGRAAKVWTR